MTVLGRRYTVVVGVLPHTGKQHYEKLHVLRAEPVKKLDIEILSVMWLLIVNPKEKC